ncbi:MAG TPA: M42 family metallopeptidase [Chitinophagales bacterium]|nr:M42 family metallopeptidase [Chitinophagales bacterium]HMW12034.1 M42 family metallopeptidase [Chitinophagales bacterium]HMX59712.1 M42 family metallopeptidase [Chitinophagales bacterium]HMY23772.1 M42 family metallopeptidase [Chitinophagales bacterium]HMZ33101.1 M42 family metallopeptidase [Chitinophagales bacterium]
MKYAIDKKAEEFLFKYLNNASPTGFEAEGQKIWLDYLKPYIDEYHVDHYGTVYGVINPEAEFKVVIEAHADEISWFVSYIGDDGMINVIRNGGSDHMIAPSMRVNLHTKKGIVKGIFGWPAIHLRDLAKDTSPSIKNITIDVGAKDKKEVESMGIHVGTVVTYEDELMILNKKFYTGRALDNRLGGFMIAQVARLVKESKSKLPFGLYICNSVQEEVGLRGAEMIVNKIKPNIAIITDVCHDTTTPMIDKKVHGDFKCGKGPVITYAPAVHNIIRELIIDTAEKEKIPFQRDAASRVTGTDTDAFAYNGGGVPSALISLPLKYMHTTVETVAKTDVEDVIKLIFESLKKINPKMRLKYLS